ncbi:interleukin-10 receptor subunit beta isoform X1 [Myiozetetes cayanensis]|uniref:interleukin-10 receptor subunit beta isoform X1 n=1 Tax=Myiozetetes cayanensis TaxID=478635 RepID=UPI00215F356D|nr:interleukin-10 receptor subunit beta isoform X1 [Myiozetetes cayanensis]
MAAALRGALFVGLLLCVAGRVPRPRNARITSVNLQSTLQWDAPRVPKGNITYTVRSKSVHFPGAAYETLGSGLSAPRCDVSSLPAYGHHELQVRAELGQHRSPWVTLRFRPLDHTVIGPPEVTVKSESGALHMNFSGPFAEHKQEKWPLWQYYGPWSYRILYWKKGTDLTSAPRVSHLDTKHSSAILSQLEPWTCYCVQVQVVIPEWNKTGELSGELCEKTTHNGVTPVWLVVTVLIGSMLAVATAVPVCFFSFFYLVRLTKHVFCPAYIFPQHLKEFLSKSPTAPEPFFPLPQEEHLYDKLTVIPEDSQNARDEAEDESETPEHPQGSEQGDSDSGVGTASGKT